MTVTYTSEVATQKVGGFFRLLFRWRGSIYSALLAEMLVFMFLYSTLSAVYRLAMNDKQKIYFEKLCVYFNQFADYVPVTFVVGFYVIRIIARRWTQWENIPWPDKFSFDVSSYVSGEDQRTRLLRRTLVRYANLGSVICFRDICVPVKKRFPTYQHLISAGLMTEAEMKLFEESASTRDANWWIPFHWAYTLLNRAQREGKICDGFCRLQDEILELINKCWVLFGHDWIQIPMVYTQVATLSVYMFMVASLFGRQYLEHDASKASKSYKIDLYIPIFPMLQIIFYLGWLKVGEVLISPMGEDADDFEINYIIDRNLNLSYSVVDNNYNKLPPLEKDLLWGSGNDAEIPYTLASQGLKDQPFKGSAVDGKTESPPTEPSAPEGGSPAKKKTSTATGAGMGWLRRRSLINQSGLNRSESTDQAQLLLNTAQIENGQVERPPDKVKRPVSVVGGSGIIEDGRVHWIQIDDGGSPFASPTTIQKKDYPSSHKFLKNIDEELEVADVVKQPGPIGQDNAYETYQHPRSQSFYPPTSMAKEL